MTSMCPDEISEASPLLTHHSRSINNEQQHNQVRPWFRQMTTLAAVVVCFFVFYMVPVLELNPYLYDMISKDYPKYNMSAQTPCTKNMSSSHSTDRKIQEKIQKRVSTLEMYLGITSRVVAMIPVLALGPLTDRYGRKIGFIWPVVGTWLKTIVYTITIRYKLPINILFVGHVCEALGGSFAAIFVATFSFISDITVPGKARAFTITIFEGTITLTNALAQVAYAHWFKTSYLDPLILGSCLGLVNIFLVIFFLPETLTSTRDKDNQSELGARHTSLKLLWIPFRLLKRCVSIYFRDSHGRLNERRLCFAVFTLVIAVDLSKAGVQNLLLMKYPLCWPNSKVYVFSGASLAVRWGCIWLLMPVFQKALNMEDRQLAIVGCVSGFGLMIFMALAKNEVMVYEAAVVGVLNRITIPVIRSMMSSLVSKADQGSMYAGFGCIETFGAGVFSTIANRIYYLTLDSFAGTIFLIFAGTYLLALVITIILNVLFKKRLPHRETSES